MDVELPDDYTEHLTRRGFVPVRWLGSGLSGTVIEATQIRLERPVAVKFCDAPGARQNPSLRTRFEREARLLARLQHPAIPYVLTTGVVPKADVPYTILQFIAGRRLRDELRPQKPLAQEVALRLMVELLDALSAAHHQRIIHRDVSPENIMVSAGRCVLIDFSIGMSLDHAARLARATETGEHLGRAEYMAPEQRVDMAHVDERCDLYAAAVVFLEMLTGSPHFSYDRLDAQLAHLHPGLRDLLKRALAAEPAIRVASAREFSDGLRPFATLKTALLNGPTTALCVNVRCTGANWSQQGYYRGPGIYKRTTDTFCGACGQALRRTCTGCGAFFRDSQYCGDCGTQWYEVPTCQTCGSWLQEEDIDTDTTVHCCTKGRRKTGWRDDDIPF